ncbi:MAG TPA: TIGR00730 family Rossman fold protein [Candidatus Dormibacteraeota bacterium]|nr:TIGR00730 family Rossman fold protein [Candidatus Dormibacteraeota bacterium]
MHTVCVFCGSYTGDRSEYRQAAVDLGEALVARGVRLVYGGGRIGLMGVVADAVLAAGGEVVGVIPAHLSAREVAHSGVTDLRVVGSMHERKQLMFDLSDAFIALPGGLGTLEELLEITTWAGLDLHRKPIGLLDVLGYFDGLVTLLDHAVLSGFLTPRNRGLILLDLDPDALLDRLEAHLAPSPPLDPGLT